jgi:hypothetical protein
MVEVTIYKKRNRIGHLEEEGARWPHRSSKPAWQPLRLPEGSTPSPLRHNFPRFDRVFPWCANRVATALVKIVPS